MSKFERINRKLNYPPIYDIKLKVENIDVEKTKSKKHGIENPEVVAFPFIIFWKRKLKNKKWVRGIFRIFEARYDIEKQKLTVVSIIQAPGIYKLFQSAYFFGRLEKTIQIFDINIEGENPRFLCRFGFDDEEKLKKPKDNFKQFIAGELSDIEEKPFVELHIHFDKSNIFYNQGFYFCDWSAKTVLNSLGIGFFGGLVHYLAFGLVYEGILTAIFAVKPLVQTAGTIFRSIKKEFTGE